ncbi:MAG: general secretion pathway protein GspL [Betaproteobacteria bacterium]|nr:general secretion pathway protein GspL [Betaproteobacteria bacterium]
MAAAPLKHGIVWLPPRSVGERALAGEPVLMALMPRAPAGAAPQRCSLESLPRMRSAVLLLNPRDVSLVRVSLPPLSPARLARALPNLLEEQLLQDPAACALVPGPALAQGERLVAVIDRAWLEFVLGAFERRGIRVAAAWPAQQALPLATGGATLAWLGDALALRLGPQEALGWAAGADAASRVESVAALLRATGWREPAGAGGDPVVDGAARPREISLIGFPDEDRAALAGLADAFGVAFRPAAWGIDPAAGIDLSLARAGSSGSRWLARIDWRAWRLPAGLSAAAALVAIVGLNLHWAQLARERAGLRAAMETSFRQAFPSAQVVVDPLLQMRRQVADLRIAAGQSGPDDFLPLLSRVSRLMAPTGVGAPASVEYRDGQLSIRWAAGAPDAPARERLIAEAARAGLRVRFEGEALAIVAVAG